MTTTLKLADGDEGGPNRYVGSDGTTWYPGDSNDVEDDALASQLLDKPYFERDDGPSSDDSEDVEAPAKEAIVEAEAETEGRAVPSDVDFTVLNGVGDENAEKLREGGYRSIDALREAEAEDLADGAGLSESLAEKIVAQLANSEE